MNQGPSFTSSIDQNSIADQTSMYHYLDERVQSSILTQNDIQLQTKPSGMNAENQNSDLTSQIQEISPSYNRNFQAARLNSIVQQGESQFSVNQIQQQNQQSRERKKYNKKEPWTLEEEETYLTCLEAMKDSHSLIGKISCKTFKRLTQLFLQSLKSEKNFKDLQKQITLHHKKMLKKFTNIDTVIKIAGQELIEKRKKQEQEKSKVKRGTIIGEFSQDLFINLINHKLAQMRADPNIDLNNPPDIEIDFNIYTWIINNEKSRRELKQQKKRLTQKNQEN